MNANAGTTSLDTLCTRLLRILESSSDGALVVHPEHVERPLKELGITSVAILNFLVAIEDELAIEWSADEPRETFRSVDTIAQALRDSYHVKA